MLVLPSHKRPDVSIVIVTAQGAPRLVRCLTAVSRFMPAELAVEVIVVLNAAERDVRTATESVRGLRIVDSEIPLGFAGGTNLGVRAARGPYVHVLHDDAEVTGGWLTALVDLLLGRPDAGAVGSMVLDVSGGVQAAGSVLWADGRTSPPWLGEAPAKSSFMNARAVDYASSAALLVRHDVWRAVGGFDEEFHPAYYVDADLAMALRRAGCSVWYEPRSRVFHEKGGSAGLRFRMFVSERNRSRFVAKWGPELQEYEPYDASSQALERARAGTAQRAARLGAAARSTPAESRAPDDETEIDRLRREHRQLRRELAVKDDYGTELEALVSTQQEMLSARELRATGLPERTARARGWPLAWLRRGPRRLLALASHLRGLSRRASSSRME